MSAPGNDFSRIAVLEAGLRQCPRQFGSRLGPKRGQCCPWQASNIVDADPTRRHEFDQTYRQAFLEELREPGWAPHAASRSMTSNSGTLIEDAGVAPRCEHSPIDDMP